MKSKIQKIRLPLALFSVLATMQLLDAIDISWWFITLPLWIMPVSYWVGRSFWYGVGQIEKLVS